MHLKKLSYHLIYAECLFRLYEKKMHVKKQIKQVKSTVPLLFIVE